MKLAYIDHCLQRKNHHEQDNFIAGLKARCIDLQFSDDWDSFHNQHGSLELFDGLLMHPGVTMQNYYLIKLKALYPNLPYAIVTAVSEDYKGDLAIFGYKHIDKILEYFEKHHSA